MVWDSLEYTFDTETANTINLPDHRKLHIDPHIQKHAKTLLARGYEIGRALSLKQGNLVMREKIVFGATGETLDFQNLSEKEKSLLKTMARIGHLAQEGQIQSNIFLHDNNSANAKEIADYTVLPEYVNELLKKQDLVEKIVRNEHPKPHYEEMDPLEGTSNTFAKDRSSAVDENEISDSDKTISDSETDTDLETPLLKFPKRRLQKCTVANIIAATKRIIRQQERDAIARKLLLQQYQMQKDKDDREIITHRAISIDLLNTIWSNNTVLDNNKIMFINKETNTMSKDKKLMEWNHLEGGKDLTCQICMKTFQDEQLAILHKELLYCKHDEQISNTTKKYLTREKMTRLANCQSELTSRVGQINEAIQRYALESKSRAERGPLNETSKGLNRKRKFQKV